MESKPPFEWLKEKPFTLSLSAGFFGFYAHAGFLAALTEQGLAPSRIAGASAGAIVGALHAAGHSSTEIKKMLCDLQRKDFWDPGLGIGLLKGKKMEALLHQMLPKNFSQLKIPLAVSTFNVYQMKTHVISEGDQVIESVRASAALPGLFHPVRKTGMLLVDGGVRDDMAVATIKPGERVLCHYLQARRKPNYFEKLSLKKVAGNKEVLVRTFTERIPLGPHLLHRGTDAIEESYARTMEWLKG